MVYLINRLPSPLLQNKSPFEKLYNRPPSLDHLRVFDCLCYATVHHTHKSYPSAKRCIFFGYTTGQKGYKVYDLEIKTFFVSCDVKFREIDFPSIFVAPNPSLISPFPTFDTMDHWSTIKPTHQPQQPEPSHTNESELPINTHETPSATLPLVEPTLINSNTSNSPTPSIPQV